MKMEKYLTDRRSEKYEEYKKDMYEVKVAVQQAKEEKWE